MIVFSGSSNMPLARKLAKAMGVRLGKVELSRFANGEVRVFVKEKPRGAAVVVQSLSTPPDQHVVELVLLADALKRLGVSEIVAVIPWLGYSKQDKVFRPGEPLSVEVIAKILQVTDFKRLVTFELHSPEIKKFFDIPVLSLSAREAFVEHFRTKKLQEAMVVAPDAGAVEPSKRFARKLGVPVAFLQKERNLSTGAVRVRDISRSVKGRDVLIVDDLIATGSTVIASSTFVKNAGASRVFLAATHQLFLPGVQRKLERVANGLVIADTIQKPAGIRLNKTSVVSCVPILARALSRIA